MIDEYPGVKGHDFAHSEVFLSPSSKHTFSNLSTPASKPNANSSGSFIWENTDTETEKVSLQAIFNNHRLEEVEC
jgi:hypothetical protein